MRPVVNVSLRSALAVGCPSVITLVMVAWTSSLTWPVAPRVPMWLFQAQETKKAGQPERLEPLYPDSLGDDSLTLRLTGSWFCTYLLVVRYCF